MANELSIDENNVIMSHEAGVESNTAQDVMENNKLLQKELSNVKNQLTSTLKDLHDVKKELELCKLQKVNAESYVHSLRQDLDRLKEMLLDYKTTNNVSHNNADRNTHDDEISPQNTSKQQLNNDINNKPESNNNHKDDSIAATLQSAAEEYLNNKGLVYDEKSGWYYDWSSGYYYDPNTHLYYHKETKAYYYYDQKKEVFIFYSYSNDTDDTDITITNNPVGESEIEEGECRSNHEEDHLPETCYSCIRCIVMQSNRLKYGSLYIITIEGVILGRDDGMERTIQIPELAISKKHAQIGYDMQENKFYICDLGSKNGTYLNDIKIANDSSTFYIQHGDYVKIGSTNFLLHIHQGYDTCDDCEPGQILSRIPVTNPTVLDTEITPFSDTGNLENQRRNNLKQLKRKYRLQHDDTSDASISTHEKYKDRAEERRINVGSDFPHALQTSSSVKKPIEKNNKGRKLLEKMGWSAGQGLGRNSAGIAQPIEVQMRVTNAGLGSTGVTSSMDGGTEVDKHIRDQKILKITSQRYSEACAKAESIDMFAE